MNLSIFNFKYAGRILLPLILTAWLFYLRSLATKTSTSEKALPEQAQLLAEDGERFGKKLRTLKQQKKKIDLIFIGNSAMYNNLGGNSKLINTELSKRLNRPAMVLFASGPGAKADWIRDIIKKQIIPVKASVPIVIFYWTGMIFDAQPKQEEVPDNKNILATISRINQEDYFRLGQTLERQNRFFRQRKNLKIRLRRFLHRQSHALSKYCFTADKRNTEEILTDIFTDIDNQKVFDIIQNKQYRRQAINLSENIKNFPRLAQSSFFPEIHSLAKQNQLNLIFLEVTTRNIVSGKYTCVNQFAKRGFSFPLFFKYRKLEHNYFKKYNYPVISLIGCQELKKEFFKTNIYLKTKTGYKKLFAEIITKKILASGVIKNCP